MNIYGRLVAAAYDPVLCTRVERAGLAEIRRLLVSGAHGRVLEIGAGTGLNLRHYPIHGIDLTVTEPDTPMLKRLERRVATERPSTEIVRATAESLPFQTNSFDSVLVTLVLCTVPDQAAALAEIHRVLTPGGSLLFLEHVRSERACMARWQDRVQPLWGCIGRGCHCNRDTLSAIRAAEFNIVELARDRFPSAPRFLRSMVVGRAQRPSAGLGY